MIFFMFSDPKYRIKIFLSLQSDFKKSVYEVTVYNSLVNYENLSDLIQVVLHTNN